MELALSCVPGIFFTENLNDAACKFDPEKGDGCLFPESVAEQVINASSTEHLAVYSTGTQYLTVAGYVPDSYTYIPGCQLPETFNPGEIINMELVLNLQNAKCVVFAEPWQDGIKEALDSVIGKYYRVLYPGLIIQTPLGNWTIVEVRGANTDINVQVALAIDTDLEIQFMVPDTNAAVASEALEPNGMEAQVDQHESMDCEPKLAELQDQQPLTREQIRVARLAYFTGFK